MQYRQDLRDMAHITRAAQYEQGDFKRFMAALEDD